MKFYPFAAINRALADARKGDTIKPVLRIGNLSEEKGWRQIGKKSKYGGGG
jgi:hypothetical protein